jgi:hypothetical protein
VRRRTAQEPHSHNKSATHEMTSTWGSGTMLLLLLVANAAFILTIARVILDQLGSVNPLTLLNSLGA